MLSGVGPAEHLRLRSTYSGRPPGVDKTSDHNMVPVMPRPATDMVISGRIEGFASYGTRSATLPADEGRSRLQAPKRSPSSTLTIPRRRPVYKSIAWASYPGVSDKPGVMFCPTLIRPESYGWLRLKSADPSEATNLTNYFSHPHDLALMVRGVRYCRNVLRTER